MAVYAIKQFEASESVAGLASSIFIIGALVSRALSGKLIDVIGRKKLLYIGLVLFFIGSVSYLFVHNISLLMIIRTIHGLGFGAATTVITTANMSALPKNKKGEGISYFSLSTAAATAIGPFLALFLTHHFTYNVLFMLCIAFSLFAFTSAIFRAVHDISLTPEQKDEMKKSFRLKDFYEKKALPISVLMFICGIAYSGIVSFINSYAMEKHLTKAASFFFVVYAIVLFLSRPIAGKIFDARGENVVVYPAFIFFAMSLFLVSIANHSIILLLAGIFLALGYGTIMSCMQSIVGIIAPPQKLGLAISTFFIFMDAGMGVGPYILGLIVEQFGFTKMYVVIAIAVLFLIPAYYFVHGRNVNIKGELES